MPVLLKADKSPLTDAIGNTLKTGQTVTDDAFGDGIVRGTVPLEKSEGLNIVIDWLGRKDATKPKSGKSRGAQLSNGGFPRTVPAPPWRAYQLYISPS